VRRSTLDELARDPCGKYVAGETWIHFCVEPRLWGVILWGKPDEAEARRLGQSLVLELAPPAVPHASLFDASRITGGDAGAFRAAGLYLARHREKLAKWVERLALVRPSGVDGALVAGTYDVLPKPYPVQLFTDVGEALAWLGAPRAAPMLTQMYGEVTGTPAEVGALRALLDSDLEITIAKAAKKLGVSQRTLQRQLGEAGTTFKDELASARVRAARRLLVDTDAPLTAIAFDVGCSSLQNFSALFRRRTGESPSAFRARARGGS